MPEIRCRIRCTQGIRRHAFERGKPLAGARQRFARVRLPDDCCSSKGPTDGSGSVRRFAARSLRCISVVFSRGFKGLRRRANHKHRT